MPWHITDFVQRNGTKIYYNPMVKFNHCEDGNTYKYGIIQHSDFIKDLNEWSEFYVAARLQKPVLQVYTKVSKRLKCFRNKNMMQLLRLLRSIKEMR